MATIDTSKLSSQIQGKYGVSNNAFSTVAQDNPKDKIDVIIGDDKQPSTFYPQVKICRWDNEVNASFRLKDTSKTSESVVTDNNKIIWQKGDVKAEYFDLGVSETHPEGAYEFNVILDKKPTSNVLKFTIETKELDFFYQPALTQEEIDRGSFSPENVVGSYAVYHKTKGGMNDIAGKDYKCGKAFHIYRPEVSDSKGNRAWGELNVDINNKLLTVTIPQKFLDEAVYPVIVDPTFGYTTAGSTNTYYPGGASEYLGGLFMSGDDAGNASLDSISVSQQTGGMSGNFKAIITNSSKQILTNGVGGGVAASTTKAWTTSSYSSKPTLSVSTNYYLGVIPDFGGFGMGLQVNADATGTTLYDDSNNYTTPTNPTDGSSIGDYKLSIYATYTASSSSAIKTVNTLAKASVKTINGLAIASVKTWEGLA